MLNTQVQYWALQESKRHNLMTEAQARHELDETRRRNLETERQGRVSLDETSRHNREQENQGWFNARESARHNKESESVGWSTLQENTRHNQAYESIQDRQTQIREAMLPYEQSESQMRTSTGYVNSATNAGDKLGFTTAGKAGIAALSLAGMLGASSIASGQKGGFSYGQAGTKQPDRPTTRKVTSHYAQRPTLSDANREKYWRY